MSILIFKKLYVIIYSIVTGVGAGFSLDFLQNYVILKIVILSIFLYNRLMGKRGKSFRARWSRFLREWKTALLGVILATRKWKFWAVFLPVLIVFGTLLSLLSSGFGAVNLFFASGFSGKMRILGDGVLSFLGQGRNFWDWLLIFLIAVLQALLIALIVLVWKKRKNFQGACPVNAGTAQNAGISAGLALLGSGCPTCGTALLTPVLGAVFSTGSYAVAGIISGVVSIIAVIIALFSLKKVGNSAYVIMVAEKGMHEKNN